ncbi:tetratricopeptide repeat protein [Tahibacter caeni]|uniref:tetratricopeptide repeat protein n=1 Tax=Tahibacter caeni TaxID=1453545 RepID=UPI00214853FE|nr:tetratricopeptide repeat protein [Tahibacter caeni]
MSPHFEAFKSAWRAAAYAQALTAIEAVVAEQPQVAALHWYRANCLLKLDRPADARAAVDRVLALNPDHAPALVKQVELSGVDEAVGGDEQPTKAQIAAWLQQAGQRRQGHIAQLRRAIAIDPNLADAYFGLSQLLRGGMMDVIANDGAVESLLHNDEADALLARAIALDPARIEFLGVRAEQRRLRAMQVPDGTPEADCVETLAGLRYLRVGLEAALADFTECARLDGGPRFRLQMGRLLHDLGRHDEAVAQYDGVLAALPADAPQREHVLDLRRRSGNGGRGELEDMAQLLESVIPPGDRNQQDDMVATAMLGAARAVRRGQRLDAAIAAHLPESPDDLLAANLAEQILNVAYEAPPNLVAADAAAFPAYQRRYAAKQRRAFAAAGLHHVADAEATGMTPTLGQRVLLGFHADADGTLCAATFVLRPKWPGMAGFLALLLSGKWKKHPLTECVSHFDDGGYLITQYENISPFEYGSVVDIERLPRSTAVAALVERHRQRVAAYRQAHPQARAFPAGDLAAIDANWRRGQIIKRDYRRSIGYASDAELRRLLGAQYERFAARIRRKIDEFAPDREAAAG